MKYRHSVSQSASSEWAEWTQIDILFSFSVFRCCCCCCCCFLLGIWGRNREFEAGVTSNGARTYTPEFCTVNRQTKAINFREKRKTVFLQQGKLNIARLLSRHSAFGVFVYSPGTQFNHHEIHDKWQFWPHTVCSPSLSSTFFPVPFCFSFRGGYFFGDLWVCTNRSPSFPYP